MTATPIRAATISRALTKGLPSIGKSATRKTGIRGYRERSAGWYVKQINENAVWVAYATGWTRPPISGPEYETHKKKWDEITQLLQERGYTLRLDGPFSAEVTG